jgi:hypothetical protein
LKGLLFSNVAAQQIAGTDLVVENPLEAVFVFAALQVKFGATAAAARRFSSQTLAPIHSFES